MRACVRVHVYVRVVEEGYDSMRFPSLQALTVASSTFPRFTMSTGPVLLSSTLTTIGPEVTSGAANEACTAVVIAMATANSLIIDSLTQDGHSVEDEQPASMIYLENSTRFRVSTDRKNQL